MKDKTPLNQTEKVNEYMQNLEHPLKAEMEAIRAIILGANNQIKERIKWNAPSFFYKEDLVTFNPRTPKHVHLVFHHPSIVNIHSKLLEGDYKDRRMAYFINMEAVEAERLELQSIMNQLV
ncbi:DUF1801 domain-containing protein [Adhaeribacter radiodurans]|uniref:DUF1801 domain-containing protein n=1 Tax=Adhaeribacter radiodurans TaxID=2745197 RepID=A0A7L7L885_9BACT|nr:DUF1801 domain-containing protein [Adhaeribacter radiodurans]QMU29017.1 DUF1801 domain-containing protein [Adhaeribacter radiodurans]